MNWMTRWTRRQQLLRRRGGSHRTCRFENMEQRRMLDADPLLVGAVYTENDTGNDAHGDTFEVSFVGGADDTQLTRLIIDGDQVGNFQNTPGLSSGDVFYDISAGGLGVDNAFPFTLESVRDADGNLKTGVSATATVIDGTSNLAIDLTGIGAGDILTFSIDVDEAENVDPRLSTAELNRLFDPLTSGAEFHGSIFTAHFSAPHFHDSQANGKFENFYDTLAANESVAVGGKQLELPLDGERGNPDRTAGVYAHTSQTPLPITIAGTVFHDRNRDLVQDTTAGDAGIHNVTIELWKQDTTGQYEAAMDAAGNPITTVTGANGDYLFDTSWNLLPGTYQLREQQPTAFTISVGAIPGTVAGTVSGSVGNSDQLTSVAVPLGGQHAIDYDFAEANPAAISGYVYHDRDDDGVREPTTEEAIPNTVIELRDQAGTVIDVTTTNTAGFYEFVGLLPGVYSLFEQQPSTWIDGKDTLGSVSTLSGPATLGIASNDALRTIELLSEDVGTNYNFGERLGSLAGRVHVDTNGNCLQDPGELALQGVTITLIDQNGNTRTTTTGIDGTYKFEDLFAGTYSVIETQPALYFNGVQTVGSGSGDSSVANEIRSVTIDDAHLDLVDYNFCEHVGSISGFVYHDRNDDGVRQPASGEEAITNVQMALLDAQGVQLATTPTDVDGFYKFDTLSPGVYTVVERHPGDWIDGKDTPGSLGGSQTNDRLSQIVLEQNATTASQLNGVNYNFGERLGSLAGRVHVDNDGDCFQDPGELALQGVTITLVDQQGDTRTTTTDVNGTYAFDDLSAGTYSVIETQPDLYFNGAQLVGSGSGDSSIVNEIRSITIDDAHADLVDYNFCEHVGSISGFVYHDRNDDGVRQLASGEEAIANVQMVLLDAQGVQLATTPTNLDGFYKFDALPPGVYTVVERHPAVWIDGKDTTGSLGGSQANDRLSQIVLDQNATTPAQLNGENYNFGERLGSLEGFVHSDPDDDCGFDQTEAPIAGVEIILTDQNGQQRSTTTDANGRYRFEELFSGTYTVVQVQPAAFFSGSQVVGTGTGDASVPNQISSINIGGGDVDLINYNFCEHLGSISGFVYHDRDNDGLREPGQNEEAIVGVELMLKDSNGNVVATTTTNDQGFYSFDALPRDVYMVMEVQPNGWLDGIDTPGFINGAQVGSSSTNDKFNGIDLLSGAVGVEYNFGELLAASIQGIVHTDINGNCTFEPNATFPQVQQREIALEGISIELYDANGVFVATATTNAAGEYQFDGLRPGEYSVIEIQPVDFFSVGEVIGNGTGRVAGTNRLGEVTLVSGDHYSGYNFCEAPSASLSGFVFRDGPVIQTNDGSLPANLAEIRDGVLTADDLRLANIVVELRSGLDGTPIDASAALPGQYVAGPIQTTTNANGFYEFAGLPRGNYAVYEIHPDGFFDSLDTSGTTTGQPLNYNSPLPQTLINFRNNPPPQFDAILSIALGYGQTSELNNFSEVQTTPSIPRFRPPPPEFVTPPPLETPPVEPITLLPLPNPPEPPRIPIYGGSGMPDVAWHLSVVDAGAARGDGTSGSTTIWIQEGDDEVWQREHLRSAQWTLHASDNQIKDETASFEYLFGRKHAIPVTGDFDGNGITDIGVYIHGDWFLDLNGNGRWDENDLWLQLGTEIDQPVTGDWDGDGKDDIGIFGPMWVGDPRAIEHDPGLPDVDNTTLTDPKNIPPTPEFAATGHRLMQKSIVGDVRADLIDHVFNYGKSGDMAVAGDWNGDGIDNIGLFRHGRWILDSDGDGRLSAKDEQFSLGEAGDIPVVMDADGDGIDDVGYYRHGEVRVDIDHNRELDAHDRVFQLEGELEHVFSGDFDGDGQDEVGRFRTFDGNRQADAGETEPR